MTHLGVGDTIDVGLDVDRRPSRRLSHGGPFRLDGPHLRLRIVGIIRRPLDLASLGGAGGVVLMTPAFERAYRGSHREPGRLHDPRPGVGRAET